MRKVNEMRKTVFAISFITAATAVFALAPFNDGFEGGRTQSCIENTGALYEDAAMLKVEGMKGKNCLALRYDNETAADFHPVPVARGKIYSLKFRGKWANKDTYENNPVMKNACYDIWRPAIEALPSTEVFFLNAEQVPLEQKYNILFNMPWGEWRNYIVIFIPPQGAAFMQMKAKAGRNLGTFYIDKAEFSEIPRTDSSLTLKFSGAEPFAGNILGLPLEEGSLARENRNLTISGYGRGTQAIPLEKGKYKVEVSGESLPGFHNFDVMFVGADGKDTGNPATAKDVLKEPLVFEMPENAAAIRLRIYNHLLDEVKISKAE